MLLVLCCSYYAARIMLLIPKSTAASNIPTTFALMSKSMAADEEDARRILRQCASSLLSACHRLASPGNGEQPSASLGAVEQNRSHQSSSNGATPVQGRVNASGARSTLEEHRALFGFQPSGSSMKRKRNSSCPKRSFSPRNTWTHTFVCLSMADRRVRKSSDFVQVYGFFELFWQHFSDPLFQFGSTCKAYNFHLDFAPPYLEVHIKNRFWLVDF